MILVTGAGGQIGSELVPALQNLYGEDAVLATDLREINSTARFEKLDVTDKATVDSIFKKYSFTQVYHLAALLSGTSEKNPSLAWNINMNGLFHILDASKDYKVHKVYWPSSIAVFGPNSAKDHTPQLGCMDPTSVYGISKLAGEGWCRYYFLKYGLDVRSLRYPGLISYKTKAGGGTTDYAVDIYFEALEKGTYTCFLKEDTYLPMLYMPDAIRATIELMQANRDSLRINDAYNLGGISFSPAEISAEIQKHIPSFSTSYVPDFRQAIADSWPNSIDDSYASTDWNWKAAYDLQSMSTDMLQNIQIQMTQASV